MAGPATLKIEIIASIKKALQGFKEAEDGTKRFGSTFKQTFAGVLAGGALSNVVSKVYAFGKQSVAAYRSAQQSQTEFAHSMERVPGITDKQTAALVAQQKALGKLTEFSGGQTRAGQATLANFNLTASQIQQLTPLMQDYATKTGKDLPTAAVDLGKALLGQGRALKAVGLNFKDTHSTVGNFSELVGGLQSKVGGLAQAMGETSAGKLQIMQNQFNALKVTLGQQLVPVLTTVSGLFITFFSFMQKNSSWLVPLASTILAVVGALKVWAVVQNILNLEIWASPITWIVAGLVLLVAGLIIAYQKVGWFRTIVNDMGKAIKVTFAWIVGAVTDAVKWVAQWISWLITNVGPIVARIFIIYTTPYRLAFDFVRNLILHWIPEVIGWLVNFVASIGRVIGAVINVISAPFRIAFDTVRSIVQSAWNFISNIFGLIRSGFEGVLSGVRAIYNGFAGVWNSLPGVHITIPSGIPLIGGKTIGFNWPKLPRLASGAYLNVPTLALVGEGSGPEWVLPDRLLRVTLADVLKGSGWGGITVNVYPSPFANPAAVGREVVGALQAYERGAGSAWRRTA